MSKIGAIQMCSSEDVKENLSTAKKLVAEAAQQGAKLVVLPEGFAYIGKNSVTKKELTEVFNRGKIQCFLSEQARLNNVWIVGGTMGLVCNDPHRSRSACLVFNAAGEIVARYDKVHLFDVVLSETESYHESYLTQPGKELAVVIETPVGKVGLAICYDIRFPEQFIALQQAGAEIIAIPSAFTMSTGKAHWELLVRARAVDSFCYVIGAAQGGQHESGRATFGNSMIVNPWGEVQAKGPGSGNAIIYDDIDLKQVYHMRNSVPVDQSRKFFFSSEKPVI